MFTWSIPAYDGIVCTSYVVCDSHMTRSLTTPEMNRKYFGIMSSKSSVMKTRLTYSFIFSLMRPVKLLYRS